MSRFITTELELEELARDKHRFVITLGADEVYRPARAVTILRSWHNYEDNTMSVLLEEDLDPDDAT